MPKKTEKAESQYRPGKNPNSQDNLKQYKKGEPKFYDELKKRREALVTDTGWEGFKQLAKDVGLSASELIERLGRGTIELKEIADDDK
jgi:hypothetical protein